jgi:hypothetical protein
MRRRRQRIFDFRYAAAGRRIDQNARADSRARDVTDSDGDGGAGCRAPHDRAISWRRRVRQRAIAYGVCIRWRSERTGYVDVQWRVCSSVAPRCSDRQYYLSGAVQRDQTLRRKHAAHLREPAALYVRRRHRARFNRRKWHHLVWRHLAYRTPHRRCPRRGNADADANSGTGTGLLMRPISLMRSAANAHGVERRSARL